MALEEEKRRVEMLEAEERANQGRVSMRMIWIMIIIMITRIMMILMIIIMITRSVMITRMMMI